MPGASTSGQPLAGRLACESIAAESQSSCSAREEALVLTTSSDHHVVRLTRQIGAEIRGIDWRARLDPETIRGIHMAWLDHLVLVFRGQRFSQEDLIRATGYFGEIGPLSRPLKYFPKGYTKLLPNIMLISNIRENGETIGALPDGEMHFHHDMIHGELPHNGTLLYSVEIPSHGGDTLFASGYAAYDTLDAAGCETPWGPQHPHP